MVIRCRPIWIFVKSVPQKSRLICFEDGIQMTQKWRENNDEKKKTRIRWIDQIRKDI